MGRPRVAPGSVFLLALLQHINGRAYAPHLHQLGAPGELSYITAKTVVHGAVGGAASDWAGGSFTDGFLGASVGQAFGAMAMPQVSSRPFRVGVAALIGGTAAYIGGGKFASGAITAAFGQAFNDCAHDDACTSDGRPQTYKKYGDKTYQLQWKSNCASVDCAIYGAAYDSADPGSIAASRASLSEFLGAIGTVATGASGFLRTGLARGASFLGFTTDLTNVVITRNPSHVASSGAGALSSYHAEKRGFSPSVTRKIGAGSSIATDLFFDKYYGR